MSHPLSAGVADSDRLPTRGVGWGVEGHRARKRIEMNVSVGLAQLFITPGRVAEPHAGCGSQPRRLAAHGDANSTHARGGRKLSTCDTALVALELRRVESFRGFLGLATELLVFPGVRCVSNVYATA